MMKLILPARDAIARQLTIARQLPTRLLLICLLAFLPLTMLFAQDKTKANELLFNHALNAPDSVERSFHSLATYLKAPAQNDREIAETIFYWVAINIAYFSDPAYEMSYPDNIEETTLLTKKSGCEGTARLYYKLCSAAGVECVIVFGIAKGYNFESVGSQSNHGWNAVNVEGKWELVDATWGGGGATEVNGKLVHVRELDLRYLFADPNDFIIDHFPEDRQWQLLDDPITKGEFFGDFYDLKRMAKLTKYN
jgi:transglutaminase/protease-like cytokinesis protein 3